MPQDAVDDRHVGHAVDDAGGIVYRGYHHLTLHPKLPICPRFQFSTRIRKPRDAVDDRHVGHELGDGG